MGLSLLSLAVGGALLLGGAEALVRGASALALRLGLSPLVVGLTVVAFGTSAPELVVSIQASLAGSGALALGNVIGSNVANIALILGLTALVRPLAVEAQLVRRDVPLVLGVTVGVVALLWNGVLGRGEGAFLVVGIAAYTVLSIRAARHTPEQVEAVHPTPATPSEPLWRPVGLTLLGLVLLVVGSDLFVGAATRLAEALGVPEAVVGLTIVAVGTSLPELVTALVAALRGAADVSVGGVVGSNLFNLLAILGVAALVHPLDARALVPLDLAALVGTALLLWPLARTGYRLTRWEGAVLVAMYAAYVWARLP